MKKVYFTKSDLTTKAYEVYSNCDFEFLEKDGRYTVLANSRDLTPLIDGVSKGELIEFLESFDID